jgi:hypothetical protein
MITIIQCAARKQANAGALRTSEGKPVLFVGYPEAAPRDGGLIYVRPDDRADTGCTWREELLRYNRESRGNPLGLLPACRLYAEPVYQALAEKFGIENTYILSAGWGLIPASFLTPVYDITFTQAVKQKAPYKLRRKNDRYDDFRMLAADAGKPIVFFGGKDYLPLFCRLTEGTSAPRTAFYRSSVTPAFPGVSFISYETDRRTNWHYDCARDFIAERIAL